MVQGLYQYKAISNRVFATAQVWFPLHEHLQKDLIVERSSCWSCGVCCIVPQTLRTAPPTWEASRHGTRCLPVRGQFFEPTVLADVTESMLIAQEESENEHAGSNLWKRMN